MKKSSILHIALFLTAALSTGLYAQNTAQLPTQSSTRLPAQNDTVVSFHNFQWGTTVEAFKAKMGNPVHTEEFDGLQSLIYENIVVSGYHTFMIVYFSRSGLEGGTYYFYTSSVEETTQCFTILQRELMAKFGPAIVYEPEISGNVPMRERRVYETSWNLPNGYVYLKANRSTNDPIALWYSSPALTRKLRGS